MAKHPGDDSRKKQKKTAPLTPAPDAQDEASLDKTQAVPVSSATRRTPAVSEKKEITRSQSRERVFMFVHCSTGKLSFSLLSAWYKS